MKLTLICIIYNVLISLFFICVFPFLLLFVIFKKRLKFIKDYFGFGGAFKSGKVRVILHCVSMGEAIAALPVAKKLYQQLPEVYFYITTTCEDARDIILRKYKDLPCEVSIAPVDVCPMILIFMMRLKPSMLIISETDIWFNMVLLAKLFRAKVFLINGRISKKAAVIQSVFKWFYNILYSLLDRIYIQDIFNRRGFLFAGAIPDKIKIYGNTKFDVEKTALTDRFLNMPFFKKRASQLVIVCGSTHKEDEMILIKGLIDFINQKRVKLVIVPRDILRVKQIEMFLKKHGVSYCISSDSETTQVQSRQVMIVNEIGVLFSLYSVCNLAYVGGGFDGCGGHSLIEPVLWGKPVLFGPDIRNVKEIARVVLNKQAGKMIVSARQLKKAVEYYLDFHNLKQACRAVAEIVKENTRVSEKISSDILNCFYKH